MDLKSILEDLGGLAGKIATAATGAGPLISAGKAVLEAFNSVRGLGAEPSPEAEANHQALVAKVNQHADATFDRAEGNDV